MMDGGRVKLARNAALVLTFGVGTPVSLTRKSRPRVLIPGQGREKLASTPNLSSRTLALQLTCAHLSSAGARGANVAPNGSLGLPGNYVERTPGCESSTKATAKTRT